MNQVSYCGRDETGRIWHHADPNRLRAWLAHRAAGRPGTREPAVIRCDTPYGYPVPAHFGR